MDSFMSAYLNRTGTLSGKSQTEKTVVIVDSLECEHLPYNVVKKDLNQELLFVGHKGLSDFVQTLRAEA